MENCDVTDLNPALANTAIMQCFCSYKYDSAVSMHHVYERNFFWFPINDIPFHIFPLTSVCLKDQ